MQYIGDETILSCITMPYELLSRLAQRINAACGGDKINSLLSNFPANSADCIVCNPPFHQQHTIGDHIAWQMFQQAYKVLRKGGELRVIGNRHLNYQLALKKLFGGCRQVAANSKFVIFSCIKA